MSISSTSVDVGIGVGAGIGVIVEVGVVVVIDGGVVIGFRRFPEGSSVSLPFSADVLVLLFVCCCRLAPAGDALLLFLAGGAFLLIPLVAKFVVGVVYRTGVLVTWDELRLTVVVGSYWVCGLARDAVVNIFGRPICWRVGNGQPIPHSK